MRVYIDSQCFAAPVQRGGISNYFTNLISAFGFDHGLGVSVDGFPIYSQNRHLREAGLSRGPLPKLLPQRRPLYQLLNSAVHARAAMKSDVVHPTYYFQKRALFASDKPVVVSVHDMMPERFPSWFVKGNPHRFKVDQVKRADCIVCVSETTRTDLLNYLPDLTVPIVVTPLAASSSFSPSEVAEAPLHLLYVGQRNDAKNFPIFLRACSKVCRKLKLPVVLVGGGPLTENEMASIAQYGLVDYVKHETPTETELVELYRRAAAFVFPTRYEGFGLPALEALASGCPAILSDTPALREVAADAALYFRPDDADQLADTIIDLCGSADLRGELRSLGLARAAEFSWGRTARRTATAYRLAIEHRARRDDT